jgi:haloalkane dehalogenase
LNIPSNLKDSYPFEPERFKLSNGHSLSYLDEGSDEKTPTLFLHGNPTWSFYYRKAIRFWKDHSRCIAVDHLGCGLSDKPSSSSFSYNLQNHANNLLELVDSLNLQNFNLVVHDWGGAIGMTAFADQAHRIRKIVLLNTAAFPSRDVPRRILFCRLPVIGEFFVRALNGFAGPATWMASSKGMTDSAKKGLLQPYGNWKNRVAIWNFVRDIPYELNHPTLSILKSTEEKLKVFSTTPVMACWGMKDFCFHGGYLTKWEKQWPHIISHRFADSGHYILEDSFEDVRAKVEPFLFANE